MPPTCLVLILLLHRRMLRWVLCFDKEAEPKEDFCHQVRLAFTNCFDMIAQPVVGILFGAHFDTDSLK